MVHHAAAPRGRDPAKSGPIWCSYSYSYSYSESLRISAGPEYEYEYEYEHQMARSRTSAAAHFGPRLSGRSRGKGQHLRARPPAQVEQPHRLAIPHVVGDLQEHRALVALPQPRLHALVEL